MSSSSSSSLSTSSSSSSSSSSSDLLEMNEDGKFPDLFMNKDEVHQTIFIRNLDNKFKREILHKILKNLFSPYGKIIKITSYKSLKLRGKAWIIYKNKESAARAIKEKQNFCLNDKPMIIEFAKEKSFLCAKNEGLKLPPSNVRRETRKSLLEKKNPPPPPPAESSTSTSTSATSTITPIDVGIPNKIIIAMNLSSLITQEDLNDFFSSCSGLQSIRLISARGLALIDFDNEEYAILAMKEKNQKKIRDHVISLTYGR